MSSTARQTRKSEAAAERRSFGASAEEVRRMMEGLSDAEIMTWHGLFGDYPPIRYSRERLERLRDMLDVHDDEKVGDTFSTGKVEKMGTEAA